MLTNQVFLIGIRIQGDETDHTSQRRNDTQREGKVDGGSVLFAHAWEEEQREGVDCVQW